MLVRMMLCAAGIAALLTSTALAQPAQPAQQSPDWTACFASQQDAEAGIRGCTAIINSTRRWQPIKQGAICGNNWQI